MWFQVITVALFASFAIVAGSIWPKMLNDSIVSEVLALRRTFPRINLADYAKILDQEDNRRSMDGYIIPTIMLTVIVVVGSSLIVLDTSEPNIFKDYEILYGDLTGQAAFDQANKGFIMMQAAFLGAFLWSLQHLLRRAQARDINPTTIYRICLYILFGMVLAIFVNHAGAITVVGDLGPSNSLPVVGFFTGYFSIEMFEKVQEIVFRKKRVMRTDEQPPPLTVIEGIGYDTALRLREQWIDDAFTLSHVNPLEIYLRTPFSLEQCIDWVGQAQLLVTVKAEAFQFLRGLGVRTILQFEGMLAAVNNAPSSEQSAYHQLIAAFPFRESEADVERLVKALEAHSVSVLHNDLAFRRLRQLTDLLEPIDASKLQDPATATPANTAAPVAA